MRFGRSQDSRLRGGFEERSLAFSCVQFGLCSNGLRRAVGATASRWTSALRQRLLLAPRFRSSSGPSPLFLALPPTLYSLSFVVFFLPSYVASPNRAALSYSSTLFNSSGSSPFQPKTTLTDFHL